MTDFEHEDEYSFDDDALEAFCQDDDDDILDTKRLRIDHSAKIVFDEKTEAMACMIEHAIMTLVNDTLDDALHVIDDFSEIGVLIVHAEKHDKTFSVALDVYSDRRGIALRQTCEGTIDNGEVIFQ